MTGRPRSASLFDAVPDDRSASVESSGVAPLAPVPVTPPRPDLAVGAKGKARDLLAAVRVLQRIEREGRPATTEEQEILGRFPGFGPVALSLFPDPVTGRYKDAGWQTLGDELHALLTPEEYASAKRTTFTAFYTSPVVIAGIHAALQRLGVPDDAQVLEPGCGSGHFLAHAPTAMRFVAIELDALSGRIARARHPGHDIRIEDFQTTRIPAGGFDAVIGNVPFANLQLPYDSHKFALHDFFLAKSTDALTAGGILAVVTSHFTLDKQNAALREFLADRADFLGAIRLPSDAFQGEGTAVVTDIVFLRKRLPGKPARHVDDQWLGVAPLALDGATVPINRYFLNHPEMVLGTWSRNDTLYGDGYSVVATGDLAAQFGQAIQHLPALATRSAVTPVEPSLPHFVPPPPLKHVVEGSFFVGPDRTLYQSEAGQSVPVTYGGRTLTANGPLTGQRLAALVGLRDHARRVLQSQNEGWPEEFRQEARGQLNRAYDRFVAVYGPINKTTFGSTAKGGVIRRMPNLVKFRDDPDAMLVMALEEYDEITGLAAKAAILRHDVVGTAPPVTHVSSAEAGLLVSLDRHGAVDLPFIAALYGQPEATVVAEFGDLIYRDPATNTWETADAYLSGNVRAKLMAAEAAGPAFQGNADALRDVQPEDVLPGDIDAPLGAPWIPARDIQQFAAALFGVPAEAIRVGHLKHDAVWSVEASYAAEQSVAATADYGTPRIGGPSLLELALNLKTPVITDPDPADPDKRVVNPEATLAAKEKQKQLKERFRTWLFADPERTERLVRVYNDNFNNLRPRHFDGAHLGFPGLNPAIELRPHQKDAVWRGMSSGNTLLAHAVGAGKSLEMAATAMKMKQAGLIHKPLIVVPNHLLEQFAREFLQGYPNAKLLVAAKEEFGRARRKLLTAQIASGDWDAIIVTQSSFERIGMSRDYQGQFLREQIAEYEQLLHDGVRNRGGTHRNLIKTLEKQKAQRVQKLGELLAADKKDDGLVFDELGIDHVFYDEAQAAKNLECPTKMERVVGIQTGGSERAFDLFMKCRYLHGRHRGHGVTFATGTPVSNSMVELYTLQKYLDPDGLRERGIDHFDAWAATFGEVVETMAISPDGKTLKPRSRFAKFINLPELQQMFRSFADVQTADMLDLPRPLLRGGQPQVVACPMSEEQQALQDQLVARYERIRS